MFFLLLHVFIFIPNERGGCLNSLFELDEQLIKLQFEASSREEVTTYLAGRLEAGGYIKSSFLPAVLEEKKHILQAFHWQPLG